MAYQPVTYDDDNIFAKILRGEQPAFTVYEDEHNLAFMDVMPQSDGHTLVLPKTAATDLFDLEDAAAREWVVAVRRIAAAVRDAFQPDGIRLMQFNGPAAGQSVFHIHMHIVPCYAGRPMRGHGAGFAETETLEKHAAMLRKALA